MKSYLAYFVLLAVLIISCKTETDDKEKPTNLIKSSNKVTIADVEKGIRSNINEMTAAGGGYFSFMNDTTEFKLKLVRVHTEYLSVLKNDEFFACVDLATAEGDVYDVDFFLEGSKEKMNVTRTSLHKLNGKPYYTWKQNKKDKTWYTLPVEEASNELLGVIEGFDAFEFTYSSELPIIDDVAQIWLPIATSNDDQKIDIIELKTPGEHQMIVDQENGNTILYMDLNDSHSNKKITITYSVERREKGPYEELDVDLAKYLRPSKLMPVDARFTDLANEIIREKNADTPLTKARAIYDYVIDNVKYAKQGVYGTGDANYACDSKSGNCTEFHSLFISLARSAGIPARFAVGAAIPSSRDEGGVDGYHCWAEFYAENKWWPVDISEADKYTALATYYFGHHPANRLELSRGRDISPEPMPQSGSINFLAYPIFENNGILEFVSTSFTFNREGPNS